MKMHTMGTECREHHRPRKMSESNVWGRDRESPPWRAAGQSCRTLPATLIFQTAAHRHWRVTKGFWAGMMAWSHPLSNYHPPPSKKIHTAWTANALGIFLFQLTTSQSQREEGCLLIQGKKASNEVTSWDRSFWTCLRILKQYFFFLLCFLPLLFLFPAMPPLPLPLLFSNLGLVM